MPFPPCDVCDTEATSYLYTRIADGETVHVCDTCQPAFAAWVLQATLGVDPDAIMAMAGSTDVQESDGRAAPAGTVGGEDEAVPSPGQAQAGPTSPESSPGDSLPEPAEPASDDATATSDPS